MAKNNPTIKIRMPMCSPNFPDRELEQYFGFTFLVHLSAKSFEILLF